MSLLLGLFLFDGFLDLLHPVFDILLFGEEPVQAAHDLIKLLFFAHSVGLNLS